MTRQKPSPAEMQEMFSYDHITGVLTRKRNRNSTFTSKDKDGYIRVRVGNGILYLHQVAFVVFHGRWPSGQIDHINGNKIDNTIANLRDVEQATNLENRRSPLGNNKSGCLGVSLHHGRWRAKIQVDRKSIVIGKFDTPEEAHQAYVNAKRRLHGGCTI